MRAAQASEAGNNAGLAAFGLSFVAICMGIVYVQARGQTWSRGAGAGGTLADTGRGV